MTNKCRINPTPRDSRLHVRKLNCCVSRSTTYTYVKMLLYDALFLDTSTTTGACDNYMSRITYCIHGRIKRLAKSRSNSVSNDGISYAAPSHSGIMRDTSVTFYCLTMTILHTPSGWPLRQFHASYRVLFEKSTPFTDNMTSPTCRRPCAMEFPEIKAVNH